MHQAIGDKASFFIVLILSEINKAQHKADLLLLFFVFCLVIYTHCLLAVIKLKASFLHPTEMILQTDKQTKTETNIFNTQSNVLKC